MADARYRSLTGPHLLRIESGQLLTAENIASRIENMYPTDEGTLRAIWGPCPYLHELPEGRPAVPYTYPGAFHGIGHATIYNGTRDLLLAHSGTEIIEFCGWSRSWRKIIGDSTGDPLQIATIPDDERAREPTKFVPTPNGIVIIPQDNVAYFYDGVVCLPLGYTDTPSAPISPYIGSSGYIENYGDTTSRVVGANNVGYAFDGQRNTYTSVSEDLGTGRVGTVERFPGGVITHSVDGSEEERWTDTANGASGQLLDGTYRAAVQWIDYFGNLSPLSGPSNAINFTQQRSRYFDLIDTRWSPASIDLVKKFISWDKLPKGPEGTIGRILARTKDINHSGTTKFFELPPNVGEAVSAFATVQDNSTEWYPDNTPDAWLIREPVYPVAIQKFKHGCMAFGRFWAANWEFDGGRVHPSMPGKWGTFLENEQIYPDPQGTGITGLHRASDGLLAFSESNTFLITPGDDGSGRFRVLTISASIGCISHSSIASMSDGTVIWLGREGFYSYREGKLEFVGLQIKPLMRRLNHARAMQSVAAMDRATGEYRCWVPVDGSRVNNLCLIFDGKGWRRRTEVQAAAVCVTQDHRSYMVVAGKHTGSDSAAGHKEERDGVWVLDREAFSYIPDEKTYVIETAWLAAARNAARTSPLSVQVWLRETFKDNYLTIEVMRDWREDPLVETQSDFTLYPEDDPPPFWGSAVFDAESTADDTSNTYRRRRPYWRRAHIAVPSCEVYKIRLTSTTPFEFLGISVGENVKEPGGARTPP